jgi:RNA polymerase sigma-70 factor (ECF subfamily)
MTGSVVDGEDVVQEALVKALEALSAKPSIAHPEGWLFRIAHNAALDFLRRRARREASHSDQDPDMMIDPASGADHRQAAAASLRTFMRLPVAQRSSVILMDVLGYSLEEIGPASRPRAAARAGAGARRSSCARAGGTRALALGRVCGALQRPRFRRDPRHARRRGAA